MYRLLNSVWFYLIASAFTLLWVAFYNGYPIVYSDTSTYLSSGFEFETPFDRPITYGLFIYLTSFAGSTLWLTVLIQSAIISYILFLLFKYFTKTKTPVLHSLLAIIFLCLLSSLPWISGMLLADIFTPTTIFSLLILIFVKTLNKFEKIFLYSIFFLSNAMHMSHLLINLFLIVTILVSSYIKFLKIYFAQTSKKQLYLLLFITLSAFLIMSSAMSKSKHIFYMGRMVENGILKKYLDEICATKNYQICAYKDSLPPNADRFLWDFENSPVYKLGGWKTTKKEFNEIINETFSQPKYIKLHVVSAFNNTFNQLTEYNLGEGNVAFPKGTKLHERIGLFVSNDLRSYEKSKQFNNQFLLFNDFNPIQKIIIAISFFALLLILFLKRLRTIFSKETILLIVFTLFGILYNDFVCASLSTVANRFACRVIWMIPFVFLLVILSKFNFKKNN